MGDDESDESESESEQAEQQDELDRSAAAPAAVDLFFSGVAWLDDDLIGSWWFDGRVAEVLAALPAETEATAFEGGAAELPDRANFMRRPPVSDLE